MEQVAKLKKAWNLTPVLQIVQTIPENFCSCLHLSIGQVWWPSSKDIFKMHSVLCTNTYHDVSNLVNHGMVKNTKTWISWKQNIIFLRNKKILDLCLRWHILRSYLCLEELTFNGNVYAMRYTNNFSGVALILGFKHFSSSRCFDYFLDGAFSKKSSRTKMSFRCAIM